MVTITVELVGTDHFNVRVNGVFYGGRVAEIMMRLEEEDVAPEIRDEVATKLAAEGADEDQLHGIGYGAMVVGPHGAGETS